MRLKKIQIIKYRNEENMDGMKKKVVSREGTLDIIKYLYDKKYTLVIATNGPTVPLKSKLEKLQIEKYFKYEIHKLEELKQIL